MLARYARLFCKAAEKKSSPTTQSVPTQPKPISHAAIPFFHEPRVHMDPDHELSQFESQHEENPYNNNHHLG